MFTSICCYSASFSFLLRVLLGILGSLWGGVASAWKLPHIPWGGGHPLQPVCLGLRAPPLWRCVMGDGVPSLWIPGALSCNQNHQHQPYYKKVSQLPLLGSKVTGGRGLDRGGGLASVGFVLFTGFSAMSAGHSSWNVASAPWQPAYIATEFAGTSYKMVMGKTHPSAAIHFAEWVLHLTPPLLPHSLKPRPVLEYICGSGLCPSPYHVSCAHY